MPESRIEPLTVINFGMNNPSLKAFVYASMASSLFCLPSKSPGLYTYLVQLGELSIRLVSLRTVICLRTICRASFAAISFLFPSLNRKATSESKATLC